MRDITIHNDLDYLGIQLDFLSAAVKLNLTIWSRKYRVELNRGKYQEGEIYGEAFAIPFNAA